VRENLAGCVSGGSRSNGSKSEISCKIYVTQATLTFRTILGSPQALTTFERRSMMDMQLFLFPASTIPAVVLAGFATWYGDRPKRTRWQFFVPASKAQFAGGR
jgi:hypothetical protein